MKKLILIYSLLTIIYWSANAQVVVKSGTWPTMCQDGAYVTQTQKIVIKETLVGDFAAISCSGGYFLLAPSGFSFDPNVGSVTLYSGGDIPAVIFTYEIYNLWIRMDYAGNGTSTIDSIVIDGIRVKAVSGAATTVNLTKYDPSTGCPINQNANMAANAKNHGTLNSVSNPPPTITYTPEPYYCNDQNIPYTLTATPSGAGGTWSGTGVSSNTFNGFGLTSGIKVITYTYNYAAGCSNSNAIGLTVKVPPTISLLSDDADNTICPNQSVTFTATASGTTRRYQFLKNGIPVTTLSTTNTYTTTNLSDNDQITVVADNGNFTCQKTSSVILIDVVTNPNPSVSVNGLPSLVCSNTSGAFSITTSPAGGVLTGNGVSGTNFSPSLAGAGNQVVTYTIVASGCSFPANTSVNVIAAPTVTLTSSDADNIICEGDLVTFTANTTGAVSSYQFYINGSGPLLTSNFYSSSILTNGSLTTVKVDDGVNTCATTSNLITTTVGKYPKSNFTWKNICGLNDVTFHDVSTIPVGNSIVSWGWDFTNNGSIDLTQMASLPDPSNSYPITNTYQTRLRTTSDKGCINDTIIRIYTLPGKTPTSSDPYAINFTSSNQGWAYDGTNSSWGWGTAPSDFGAGSRNVWSTGQNSPDGKYKTDEHSYLYGPCINFSQLDKPMLAIKLSSKIIDKPAGAILEVTSDEGLNWVKLGNLEEGINWYNVAGIVATPFTYLANSTNNNPLAQGWSTSSVNFDNNNLSKIGLQSYSGKTSVRFRINFASVADISAARFAGIGIDSFWIGNRNKIALIEHLTNKSGARACCLAPDNAVDFIIDKRKSDVVSINYHTSFPTGDAINLVYPNAGSSKVLFYGNSSPKTILNGIKYNGAIYSGGTAVTRLDTADVDAVVLENAIFKIDLTTIITANNVTAKVKINYIDNKTIAKDIILHFVVVEDTANGNPIYNNSCRQMLPDPAGNFYFGPNFINSIWQWTPGSFIYSSQSWNHSLPANAKLKVIVFIQDAYTKEVYQATYVKGSGTYGNVVVLSNSDEVKNQQNIDIYPNPSSDQVNVVFEGLLKNEVYWQLLDNMGKLIKDGKINEGKINYEIDTHEISNGLYNIKFTNGNTIQNKKIIITK